jgi:predicted DNA-binding protein with PD1-like motif
MKYTEANIGRIFILRLEHGDRIPQVIEDLAKQKNISSATVLFMGGAAGGSKVIIGPQDGAAAKPIPVVTSLPDACEAVGVGTIFTNESNIPKLHLHAGFGRTGTAIIGCTREGVDIWHIGEVVILELVNHSAQRKIDPKTGFELLEV